MSENNLNPQPIKFWSDYYSVKKPRCLECLRQGIKETEYKFCSTERKPVTVYDERGKEVVHVFEDIYACNVYHWTLFQGQGKINRDNKPESILATEPAFEDNL
jgi:hypothetical protein